MNRLLAAILLIGGGTLLAAQETAPAQGILTAEQASFGSMVVPTDSQTLMTALSKLTSNAHVALGIELDPEVHLAAGDIVRYHRLPNMKGYSVAQAITTITQDLKGYSIREGSNSVLRIAGRGHAAWLDQLVPAFDLKDATLLAAFVAVHRAINPDFQEVKLHAPLDPDGAVTASLARTFSVSLRNATIAQVLDAIVAAHGGSSWIAYQDRTSSYEDSQLGFAIFEGQRVMLPAVRRKAGH